MNFPTSAYVVQRLQTVSLSERDPFSPILLQEMWNNKHIVGRMNAEQLEVCSKLLKQNLNGLLTTRNGILER